MTSIQGLGSVQDPDKEAIMPLINFGSILNFAEEIETQDLGFYQTVALRITRSQGMQR